AELNRWKLGKAYRGKNGTRFALCGGMKGKTTRQTKHAVASHQTHLFRVPLFPPVFRFDETINSVSLTIISTSSLIVDHCETVISVSQIIISETKAIISGRILVIDGPSTIISGPDSIIYIHEAIMCVVATITCTTEMDFSKAETIISAFLTSFLAAEVIIS